MNQKKDRNFDKLAQRFQKRIYQSPKGNIRLLRVQQELAAVLEEYNPQHTHILDAGAGLGQMSCWLAQKNYSITACDPSINMLAIAQENFTQHGIDHNTIYSNQLHIKPPSGHIQMMALPIQDMPNGNTYDIIIFHAVLEWLARPQITLKKLLEHLTPGGTLSLLFYNQHAIALRSLLGGDLQRVLDDNLAGIGTKGLTPISPLVPSDVYQWLIDWGMEITLWSGIRSFYDYMKPEAVASCTTDMIIHTDQQLSQQEPWRSIARYQHMIIKKPYL